VHPTIEVNMSEAEVVDRVEILFAVEGHRQHFSVEIGPRVTVIEFASLAAKAGGLEEPVEIFLEDAEQALTADLVLLEHLAAEFAPLHVARPGEIETTVDFNGRDAKRKFKANATIIKIIAWAISPEALNLEGTPSDFQLKFDGEVLPPDLHLGQVARGKKAISLSLVFKVKPQGDRA
jgi:hypothetical protein